MVRKLILGLGCALVTTVAARAQVPTIETFDRPIAQRGEEVEIEFLGANLSECREIVFYQPGLQCRKIEPIDDYSLGATISAEPECAIGSHPFRLLGAHGFSELQTLRVGPFPVIMEQDRPSRETAIELSNRNQSLCGTLEDGDYDRYVVELKRGQQFSAEVEAMRLGGPLLDAVLQVTAPSGELIAASDDGYLFRQDPAISFTANEPGAYTIEVHESTYGGSQDSHYVLHLGEFPLAGVAFPAGGQIGRSLQVEFLPQYGTLGQTLVQNVTVDDANFRLFASRGNVLSPTPTPFRVSSFPNVFEPQDSSGSIHTETPSVRPFRPPVAFNGLLEADGDVDQFGLLAEAGEQWQLEVFADRIGSPVDSVLSIVDSSGRLVMRNDDWDSHDSRLEFHVPESDVYQVRIEDKLQAGSPTAVYRIEVTALEPELVAFLPRPERTSQRNQTVSVPQGNRALTRIGVRRARTGDSEVQLRFVNLPQGVHASPVFVPKEDFWALAVLEAEPKADIAGALVTVVPSCVDGKTTIQGEFVQVVDLIAESADRLYQAAKVKRLAVAVAEAMPFQIELQQPPNRLAVGGTLNLTVRVVRSEGFTAPVRIEFPYLPDGCVGPPHVTVAGDETEASYPISATQSIQLGEFSLVATGKVDLVGRASSPAAGDGQSQTSGQQRFDLFKLKDRQVCSLPVQMLVGKSPVLGQFAALAAEQGSDIKLACELQSQGEIPEQLTCHLEGLPNRVTSEPVSLRRPLSIVEFPVSVPIDAPLGSFAGIQCRMTGQLNGAEVSYVVRAKEPLLITKEGELARAADGSLLSPLEALRGKHEQ